MHTHPPGQWAPSKLDIAVARRTGIPVYVLTPERIAMTTDGEADVVVEGEWGTRRR